MADVGIPAGETPPTVAGYGASGLSIPNTVSANQVLQTAGLNPNATSSLDARRSVNATPVIASPIDGQTSPSDSQTPENKTFPYLIVAGVVLVAALFL